MRMQKWKLPFIFFPSLFISSCIMVGPNFHSPKPPPTQKYTSTPLPTKTAHTSGLGSAGQSQAFIPGGCLPEQWWHLFHSKQLNTFILQGIANSPNLAAAEATLRQAQELLQAEYGLLLLPSINGSFTGQRQKFSSTSLGTDSTSIFNLYNASVNVAYTFDIWGGARRQIEYYYANVDYERYQLIAAYLSLTSNIVTTVINIAYLEKAIDATQMLLAEETKSLVLLKKQFKLGGISLQNVLTQQTQVQQTAALLPPLHRKLYEANHALAVLIGIPPSDLPPVQMDLDKLYLPKNLPISLPSCLIRQRPDVLASEALLHEASAQIGVATANLLPQFSITGNDGWQSGAPGGLFHAKNNIWSYGGQLLQPLFRGGALMAQRREAIEAYNAALEQYRQTVLQALQNTADSLRAIQTDAKELATQRNAETAAKHDLELVTQQFYLGAVNYLALLIAEQQYQQTLINRIQAEAARFSDTAALFAALGGGWWVVSTYPLSIKAKLDPMVSL